MLAVAVVAEEEEEADLVVAVAVAEAVALAVVVEAVVAALLEVGKASTILIVASFRSNHLRFPSFIYTSKSLHSSLNEGFYHNIRGEIR